MKGRLHGPTALVLTPSRATWRVTLALALAGGCAATLVASGESLLKVVLLLAAAPLLEEAVFRAGLQETLLRRWNAPFAANLWTALAFGFVHVAARRDADAFGVALPALLIGAAYQRWRRLRWCVTLHMAMNALWVAGRLAPTLPLLAS